MSWSNEIAKIGREHQKSLLLYALSVVESCTSVNYGNELTNRMQDEEIQFIHDFSKFINTDTVIPFNDLFNSAIYHIERNGHAPTLFLDVSLQATRLFHNAAKKNIGK